MKASAFNLLLGGQKPLSKEELGYVLAAFDQVSLSLQIIPEMFQRQRDSKDQASIAVVFAFLVVLGFGFLCLYIYEQSVDKIKKGMRGPLQLFKTI